jgi:hypothetical protein
MARVLLCSNRYGMRAEHTVGKPASNPVHQRVADFKLVAFVYECGHRFWPGCTRWRVQSFLDHRVLTLQFDSLLCCQIHVPPPHFVFASFGTPLVSPSL